MHWNSSLYASLCVVLSRATLTRDSTRSSHVNQSCCPAAIYRTFFQRVLLQGCHATHAADTRSGVWYIYQSCEERAGRFTRLSVHIEDELRFDTATEQAEFSPGEKPQPEIQIPVCHFTQRFNSEVQGGLSHSAVKEFLIYKSVSQVAQVTFLHSQHTQLKNVNLATSYMGEKN